MGIRLGNDSGLVAIMKIQLEVPPGLNALTDLFKLEVFFVIGGIAGTCSPFPFAFRTVRPQAEMVFEVQLFVVGDDGCHDDFLFLKFADGFFVQAFGNYVTE